MRILPLHSSAYYTLLCLVVVAAACSSIEESDQLPDAAALRIAVSEPVAATSSVAAQEAGWQGLAVAGEMMAYVSLPPETFPDGEETTITNLATGTTRVVPMVNGGFDPVPIAAEVGDTLQIEIIGGGRDLGVSWAKVPFSRVPMVVRTDPPKRKVAVLLKAMPYAVFSEPMAPSTINPETIFLEARGERVEGAVQPSADGLRAVFQPATDLEPLTEHLFVITTGVTDLAGDPLDEEVMVEFTTIDTTLAIAFGLGRSFAELGLWRMNSDGSGLTHVLPGPPGCCAHPAWAPDGWQLAFVAGGGGTLDIYKANADGSGLTQLTNAPGNDTWPAWSPDGSQIAFGSQRNGSQELYVMEADGSNQLPLISGEGTSPSWSPDGSRIVFTGSNNGIYMMNADGTGQTQLTVGWGPRWSPDDTRILFYFSGREGRPDIYVINLDGTEHVNLTNHLGLDWFPAWSPDGSQIVFTRSPVGAMDADIYVMNADGTGVVRLSTDDGDEYWQPSWRP